MPPSPGLSSLYRQLEAGTVDLPDAPEPPVDAGLPDHLGIFFGVDPWTPAREGGSKPAFAWASDLRTRETLIVELCPVCLDGPEFGGPALGPRMACGGRLRSALDTRIRALLAEEGLSPPR
jgi:hypothetical protein